MSELVDVTYRGLKVATRAKATPVDAGCLFVEHETPLPVGAPVSLARDGEALDGRVVAVIEQEGSAKGHPGMKIRWKDDPAAAAPKKAPAVESIPMISASTSMVELEPDASVPEPVDERSTEVMAVPPIPRTTSQEIAAQPEPKVETPGARPDREPRSRDTIIGMPAMTGDPDTSGGGDPDASDAGASSGRRRRRRKNGR
jgi:hypothetical protein